MSVFNSRIPRMPLGELLLPMENRRKLQQGWSPRCLSTPAPNEETWGVVKTTAIQAGWFDDTQHKELPENLTPRPAIEIRAGDLLMTCAGPRSRCGIPTLVRKTRPRLMMSGKMYRFRPKACLDPGYLEKWLLSPEAQQRIDVMKTGISDSGLNLTQDRFLQLPVPLPDLEQQKRVVANLEGHLSRLDIAGASLDRCETMGLAAETSWLRRLASPVGSEMSSIGAELVESRGGWSRSARHSVSTDRGVPYLKMNNIQRRGTLFLDELTHVEASLEDLTKYALREGDVLFNSKNSGDLIGKTALADQRVVGATFNENIMRLRFAARLDPAFVVLWFLSPIMRRAIRSAASASTNVAAVYKHQLVEMPIWVPDKELQLRLVQEFGDLRASIERLGWATAGARRRSSTLRRAVLAAAFEGKLTGRHTDAEVIEELAEA